MDSNVEVLNSRDDNGSHPIWGVNALGGYCTQIGRIDCLVAPIDTPVRRFYWAAQTFVGNNYERFAIGYADTITEARDEVERCAYVSRAV